MVTEQVGVQFRQLIILVLLQVCRRAEQVFVVTHLWWLRRDTQKTAIYSFQRDARLKRGSFPHPKPLVSRLRYASQVIPIRSPYLNPRDYRPFKVIQSNTIRLAHSDKPCIMQKYGKLMEVRFHELEHESEMWLLKTHSHTSERRVRSRQETPRKKGIP